MIGTFLPRKNDEWRHKDPFAEGEAKAVPSPSPVNRRQCTSLFCTAGIQNDDGDTLAIRSAVRLLAE